MPFEEIDRDRFFGRESATEELFSMVWAYKTCVVYGQSGSGKSSLVRAGLIPKAREEGMELLPLARVQGSVSADLNLDSFCDPYTYFTLVSWGLKDDLLHCSLAEALNKRKPQLNEYGERVIRLVVFDQFEELFTAFPGYWQKRQSFVRDLGIALEDDPALHVVLIARQDHLAEMREVAERLPDGLKGQFPLHRLRPQQAAEAIDCPVRRLTNRTFEDGVVAELVNDLMKIKIRRGRGPAGDALGEYVEPVQLQVVCTELWRSLPPDVTVITRTDVQKFGDPNEALARFYISRVTEAARRTKVPSAYIRRWFEKVMITPAGTRAMAYQDDYDTAGLPNATVRELEDQHLLRAEDRAGARWFELTHDRFIAPIRTANSRLRLLAATSYWGVLAVAFFLAIFFGAGLSKYHNGDLYGRALEVVAAVALLTFAVAQVSHRLAKSRMKPVRRGPGHRRQTALVWTLRTVGLITAVLLVWGGITILHEADQYFRACWLSPNCSPPDGFPQDYHGPFNTWTNADAYSSLWGGTVLLGFAVFLFAIALWPRFYIWRISRWQARMESNRTASLDETNPWLGQPAPAMGPTAWAAPSLGGSALTPPWLRLDRRGWLVIGGIAAACVIAAVGIVVGASSGTSQPKQTSYASLTVGDCLQTPSAYSQNAADRKQFWTNDNIPLPDRMPVVSCGTAHSGEVFFAGDAWPAHATYPGDNQITSQGDTKCEGQFAAYVGVPDSRSAYYYISTNPDQQSWSGGDRRLTCIAYEPAGNLIYGTLKGSHQ